MTTFDELNRAAVTSGGRWINLKAIADGAVDGEVLDYEIRPMTFEGAPVLKRGSGEPRHEWLFTLRVGEGDEGVVKLPLRESGQRAVREAIKAAGGDAKPGDRLKIAVSIDKEKATDQPTFQARWTKAERVPTSSLDLSMFDDVAPTTPTPDPF